ncbi:MAG: hypothetical protein AAB495_01420 [Patescibacteria group bacterium]
MSSEVPQGQDPTVPFELEKSPAREAYLLLGAKTPLELSNLYSEEDQRLMLSQSWDYGNPELIVNKVKEILESIDPGALTEDEREWRQEILWFWYHHAISCAIWKYKDKDAAQKYATKALEGQSSGHPNQITRLLDHLVNGRLEEAERWAERIREEPEKSTATSLIKEYNEEGFF